MVKTNARRPNPVFPFRTTWQELGPDERRSCAMCHRARAKYEHTVYDRARSAGRDRAYCPSCRVQVDIRWEQKAQALRASAEDRSKQRL